MPTPSSPRILAAVALGGILGAWGRDGVGRLLPGDAAAGGWPWATFAVNVVGCAVVGLLVPWLVERRAHQPWLRPFAVTGVLGGFTTFSAFAEETRVLLDVRPALALGYVGATLVAGIGATALTRAVSARTLADAS